MNNGNLAVAIVQRQVMLVQATRSHVRHDEYLDVHTFSPFGHRVFLASTVPNARIATNDILTIFPDNDGTRLLAQGMLEIPHQAFCEFEELRSRHQKRCESLWNAWIASQ